MGYKSTEDPLYSADKLIVRATPLVDPDNLDAYLDVVVERYKEKADMTAKTAYTSSSSEANPNCGKEVIDNYLEQAKLNIIESDKTLHSVFGYLILSPLPAARVVLAVRSMFTFSIHPVCQLYIKSIYLAPIVRLEASSSFLWYLLNELFHTSFRVKTTGY